MILKIPNSATQEKEITLLGKTSQQRNHCTTKNEEQMSKDIIIEEIIEHHLILVQVSSPLRLK